MKIVTLGHSHVHLRQQRFFQAVAEQGHDVLMIAPQSWGELTTQASLDKRFRLETVRRMGEDIYSFRLLGVESLIQGFQPDWVYVQEEWESQLARDGLEWGRKVGAKCAVFGWENLHPPSPKAQDLLKEYDLVICGNGEAEAFVKPHARRTAVMLQVGIDTDHFAARPDVPRSVSVGFLGRPVPEKGLEYLAIAWPTAQRLPYKRDMERYLELPWWYSTVKIVVVPSIDTHYWKEQAPPYVSLEAMACGAAVVTSDAGSIPYWMSQCPGAVIVRQKSASELRRAIQELLADEERRSEMGRRGREWVVEHFSNPVVARKLVEVLEDAG